MKHTLSRVVRMEDTRAAVFAGHGLLCAIQTLCPKGARATDVGEPMIVTYALAKPITSTVGSAMSQLIEAMAKTLMQAHREWRRHRWGPFRWGRPQRLVVRRTFDLHQGENGDLTLTCRIGFE